MRFRHALPRGLSGRHAALPFVALAVLTTFACSLDKLTQPQGKTATLQASVAGDTTVALGGSAPMSVTTAAGTLGANSGVVVKWSVSDPAIATIDANTGVLTGVALGTVTVSAKVAAPEIGEVSATTQTVRVKYAGIRITTVDSMIAIGMTKVIQVRGTNSSGVVQAVIPFSTAMTVASRDANIFDVNTAGALVAKANGTARLFVQYDNLKDSVNVKVRQVARAITFPTAVNNELAIQSIAKDRTLQVTPKDSLGVAITGSTVTWSTSDATTVTVGATTGLARGLKLGTARIRATVDGKVDSIVARVTQVAAVINKLAGDAQTATVGTAVTTVPSISVVDSGNTPIPSAAVTFAIASGGGSLTGATPTASLTGVAAVGSWTLGTTAGANTLTASSDGASATFTATGTPGVASKLIFTTQPSNSATGAAITTFRVAVADANDNVVTTATNSIAVSIATSPSGATAGGTLTVAAVNGVATFSAVTLSATGTYTITATTSGLTPATSNTFAIFGPATKLGFVTQPVGNTATIPMQTFRVAVQDAAGNTVTTGTASTATVTLTLNTGSFTAGSAVSVPAVAGIATFSNVAAAAAGTFTITATATGFTAATSNSITVAAVGPAAKLAFTVQPANGVAGTALADIKVTVQDANGVTNSSSTAAITLGIETNVGGASISSGVTTVNAVAGVATFSGIALNKAGTGYKLNATSGTLTKGVSGTFNITAGAAFKLGFAAAVPNAVIATAINPAVQVQVQDANGNVVTTATNSITVTATGGTGTLTGGTATAATAGVATFSGLALSTAGTYNLVATATGLQNGTSSSFSVVSATAAIKLAFITQPTNVAAGTAISPSIQVAVQDASGNTVSSTAGVTLAIAGGPTGSTISGTVTRAAVAGVATFDNITLPLAGASYTLSATSTGLTTATSATFNVTPGAATKMAWLTQPVSTTAGVPFASDLQLQILDANNNVVTTATNTITLQYSNNSGSQSSTLKGSLSVPAVNGVVTFPGIRITRASTGYTLFASGSGLSNSPSSNSFDITAAPATALTFKSGPNFVTAGALQSPSIQVAVADSLGNTVTTATSSITLAVNSAPTGGVMSGTATQVATAGVATFADVTFNKTGSYTLTATATDLATVTSNSFFVQTGAAAKLAFIIQPTNTFLNAPMNPGTNQVQVQIQDAFGNQISSNANVVLSLGTNPTGAALTGTTSGPASFGNFTVNNDVMVSKAGTGYTLTVSSTGLTSATSTSFDVGAFSTASLVQFQQAPTTNITDANFSPTITAAVTDQYGNVVTSGAASTASLQIGCQAACSQVNTTANATLGVASFPNYQVSTPGTYTFFAASNGFAGLNGTLATTQVTIWSPFAATVGLSANNVGDAVINNGNLFWLDRGSSGGGTVKQTSLSTGSQITLSSVGGPANMLAILTDGTNVWWTDDAGNLKRVAVGVANGTVTTVVSGQAGMGSQLMSDGTSLFFYASNGVNREIRKVAMTAGSGTTPTTFFTTSCGPTCNPTFTISGTTIWFYDQGGNAIKSSSTSALVAATIVTAPGTPISMTVGGGTLYYATSAALFSASSTSTNQTAVNRALGTFSATTKLGYDGSSLYAMDAGNALLRRINTSTFTAATLFSVNIPSTTQVLAFDGTFVYFADNASGNGQRVRRVLK